MEKANINGLSPIWEALFGEAKEVVARMKSPKTNQIQRLEMKTAFLTGENNPSIDFLLKQARTLVELHKKSCQIVRCEAFQRFVGTRAM